MCNDASMAHTKKVVLWKHFVSVILMRNLSFCAQKSCYVHASLVAPSVG